MSFFQGAQLVGQSGKAAYHAADTGKNIGQGNALDAVGSGLQAMGTLTGMVPHPVAKGVGMGMNVVGGGIKYREQIGEFMNKPSAPLTPGEQAMLFSS